MYRVAPIKTYVGSRSGADPFVCIAHGLAVRPLRLRPDMLFDPIEHIEWGYIGRGPELLAASILADHFEDDRVAFRLAEDFMTGVIAKMDPALWTLTGPEIDSWYVSAIVAEVLA